jgi:hypothetical protein
MLAKSRRQTMTKSLKLNDLIAETYTADDTKYFGFADRGNGCGFGEAGQTVTYDDNCAREYGDIILTACSPIIGEDGRSEYVYASDWIDGQNGYQFRVLF